MGNPGIELRMFAWFLSSGDTTSGLFEQLFQAANCVTLGKCKPNLTHGKSPYAKGFVKAYNASVKHTKTFVGTKGFNQWNTAQFQQSVSKAQATMNLPLPL